MLERTKAVTLNRHCRAILFLAAATVACAHSPRTAATALCALSRADSAPAQGWPLYPECAVDRPALLLGSYPLVQCGPTGSPSCLRRAPGVPALLTVLPNRSVKLPGRLDAPARLLNRIR